MVGFFLCDGFYPFGNTIFGASWEPAPAGGCFGYLSIALCVLFPLLESTLAASTRAASNPSNTFWGLGQVVNGKFLRRPAFTSDSCQHPFALLRPEIDSDLADLASSLRDQFVVYSTRRLQKDWEHYLPNRVERVRLATLSA